MRVEISKGKAKGNIVAPPSKSMAHRNLICGSLSNKSIIENISLSKDITATLGCLEKLGAKIINNNGTITIGGLNPKLIKSCTLNCNESGSTLRFMIPICLLSNQEITLTGSKRLLERPLNAYETLFKEKGVRFYKDQSGIKVKGSLKGGVFKIDASISSQFITGLLFALPLLEEDSKIEIQGNLTSRSYLDLTLSSLKEFGIKFDATDIRNIRVFGGQNYNSKNISVEGDYSNSAFFEALNLLGGNVNINGLNKNSLQGDKVYTQIFEQLQKGTPTVSLEDCPDLGPVLFSMAAVFNGATFTNTDRLRVKESDRVNCVVEELSKFGIKADVFENSVKIHKSVISSPKELLLGHNDHRIVMSLAVLSTITGGIIEGAEAVSKSFPDFFGKLKELGIKVKIYET